MAKIVYLRTDKNGTKYYANYTCPRMWRSWRI